MLGVDMTLNTIVGFAILGIIIGGMLFVESVLDDMIKQKKCKNN